MEEPGLPADVSGGAFLQAFHGSQAGYIISPSQLKGKISTRFANLSNTKVHHSQNVVLSGKLRRLTLNSWICLDG